MFLKYLGLYTKKQLNEAADARLELVAMQQDQLASLYQNRNVGFDVGYTMSATRCAKITRSMKMDQLNQSK